MEIEKIVEILEKEFKVHRMPVVDLIQVQTDDPFKILVTTILSARTKDVVTSEVVKNLFKQVDNYKDLENLTLEEIEKLIFKIGFFHNKAKYLKKLPEVLTTLFDGIVPQEIDELTRLPGVGRKTANLVRAIAFNKPAICVDIHVHRIKFNSILVSHGQNVCKPRNPNCSICKINKYCQKIIK